MGSVDGDVRIAALTGSTAVKSKINQVALDDIKIFIKEFVEKLIKVHGDKVAEEYIIRELAQELVEVELKGSKAFNVLFNSLYKAGSTFPNEFIKDIKVLWEKRLNGLMIDDGVKNLAVNFNSLVLRKSPKEYENACEIIVRSRLFKKPVIKQAAVLEKILQTRLPSAASKIKAAAAQKIAAQLAEERSGYFGIRAAKFLEKLLKSGVKWVIK